MLIKSKILYTVQASELWTNLINLVLDLYTKKQWLREECGWVLYQALLGFKDKPSLYNNVASLFEQLAKRNYLKTLESIVLWVECRSGGFDGLRLPTSVFHNDSPLHHKERRTLMTALQGTTTTTDDAETQVNQNRGATWSNKIHFAWIIIFDASQKVKTNGSLLSVNELVSDVRFTKLWHNFVDGESKTYTIALKIPLLSNTNSVQNICSPLLLQNRESIGDF